MAVLGITQFQNLPHPRVEMVGASTGASQQKQHALSYLQQLQDPITLEQSYNLLQEMELGEEDEDEFNNILMDDVGDDQTLDDVNEVIFSPCPDVVNIKTTVQVAPDTRKWGPVQAQRKSCRVDIGNRTMTEIAMDSQKVQNLETDKKNIKECSMPRCKTV